MRMTKDDGGREVLARVVHLLDYLSILPVEEEMLIDLFPCKPNQEFLRHPLEKKMATTPCSSSSSLDDQPSTDLGWNALEDSIHKLATTVPRSLYYDDDDSDEDEDKNRESRLENVKLALALLPVLKATCGSVYSVPVVRAPCYGSIEFAWTNQQTLSAATCSIRIEEKEREVGIAKYIIHGEKAIRFFPFSADNRISEDSIGKTLQGFLSDVLSYNRL